MPNPNPNPKPAPRAGLDGFDAYRVAREFFRLVLQATAHLPRSRRSSGRDYGMPHQP